MKLKKTISAMLAAAMTVSAAAIPVFANEEETAVYLDTTKTFEERAADLVSRMTLEEKVAQLSYSAPAIDRLGVKKYNYWMECLHGVARQGKATNYPASLSLSNTWNRELIHTIADETSTEARAKNNRYNLSYYTPTINMARDPRWGRNEETYGEDPYLTGQLGAAFVKGMQGDDEKYTKIIATIKHFAANNNEKNRRGGSSYMTEFNFRNYYTKVFENVAEQVMPGSVMSSYNATSISRSGSYIYNFVPSSANKYLLTDLLRRSWGFDGYVTTDCGAGNDIASIAQYEQGIRKAEGENDENAGSEFYVASAVKNGMDLECNLSGGNTSTAYGVKAIENGYMTEEELETAIYHLFLQRMRTGEFDDNATSYRSYTANDIESAEHISTAEKAAEESWVLLKNDDNMLPLENVTKVAVVGDLADKLVLGDYTGSPYNTVTPIEGLKAVLGEKNIEVNHVGAVADDTPLFNVKSIKLVKSNGSKTMIDITQAQSVSGMNTDFTNVTPRAAAYIPNVNFENVTSVEVEMETGSMWGGSLNIAYGQGGPTVAVISSPSTGTSGYTTVSGDYTGADGGYNGTRDMYISASAAVKDFSVSAFKSELDSADVILAYAGTIPKQAGLGDADSSESKDRETIDLPSHQAHVQAICNAYPDKTVVAMSTVGQINVEPFKDKCKAILWTSYNGQTQGTALGKILAGDINPSGRLTTTWYKNSDVQKMELYNNTNQTIDGITGKFTNYNIQPDGTNPGHTYMYYSGDAVYPFGYGLSYTNFAYSDMTVDKTETTANGKITASVKVKNTGTQKGSEVVQLYVSHPENTIFAASTPKKQLKGFEKVTLEPDEEKTVTFDLDISDMALFDEAAQKNIVPAGEYTICIGKNAADTSNSAKLTVSGTLDSTLKTVKAMPNGITLNGVVNEDGTSLTSKNTIDARVSAVMSDESFYDLASESVPASEPAEIKTGFAASMTYSNGKLKVKSNETVKADIIRATYSGSKLGSVEILKDKQLTANETVSFDITASDGDKIMLWDSTDSMKSLAETITASNNSGSSAVTYTSSDEEIASVTDDGIVSSGTKEGTATITVSVTVNGETKTDSFPVVNSLSVRPNAAKIAAAKAELKTAYDSYDQNAYKDATYALLTKIYTDALTTAEAAETDDELAAVVADAKTAMSKITPDKLEVVYTISSENENILKNDIIDYRAGGIPPYSGATGTVTNAQPYENIQLLAKDENGNTVSGLVWSAKQIDGSSRQVADITADGSLTVYGYGAVEITAMNAETYECARQIIYINMQIEGEYADNSGGANLTDNQTGTSNGLDVGSTGANWIEFKGVKISGLKSITLRHARKGTASKTANISLTSDGKTIIASGSLPDTDSGKWNVWQDTALTLNNSALKKAETDENGLATIYVQTNGANLDYIRLTYSDGTETHADSTIVAHYFGSANGGDYTKLTGGTENTQYTDTVNGLCGYGAWGTDAKSGSYTYTDINGNEYTYNFTNSWKGGRGGTDNLNLFFTPTSECNVTVVFDGNGSADREMNIYQSDSVQITGKSAGNAIADSDVSLEITDTTKPVYIYGGGSNKRIYAVIIEYYGKETVTGAADEDVTIQSVDWNGSEIILTKNEATGVTALWNVLPGGRAELYTNQFYSAPDGMATSYPEHTFTINAIDTYKSRLFAGCDGGYVMMLTDCMKCYQLKKPVDFDVKELTIDNGIMTVSDGVNTEQINMSDLGGDTIEAEDAKNLIDSGKAVLIDLREATDYDESHYTPSVNVLPANLEAALDEYSTDQIIIFACYSGNRAAAAIETAKSLGFDNTYNLGSIDNIL